MLLLILVVLLILISVFSAMNRLLATEFAPALADFIGGMLLSMGIISLFVLIFSVAGTRILMKKPLLAKPSAGEGEWSASQIWRVEGGTELKDAVWYGMIYVFVPCLLYRWAFFLPKYPLETHAPFLAALAIGHLIGFVTGAGLEWIAVHRQRDSAYARKLYPQDWQLEKNIQLSKIKVMGILIPLILASWVFFLWKLTKVLP
jgi:carbon starvation protein CstA